ncbi:MAG: L,D-transpeptidase family protein [Hyphomicrobiales bacterium]
MHEAGGIGRRTMRLGMAAAVLAMVTAGAIGAAALVATPEGARTLQEALERSRVAAGAPVYVRIFKQESELELWAERDGAYVLVKRYPICTWSGALGPKLREGDLQSPEGFYRVTRGLLNPNSRYHLSFNIGFPNAYDRAHGRTGSFLMVHGNCVSIGCYAMTDPGIEEIYGMVEAALDKGQPAVPVHIFPFRMTEDNLERHRTSEWIGFWRNLKQGYDAFEAEGRPPEITVSGGAYRVVGRRSEARTGRQ